MQEKKKVKRFDTSELPGSEDPVPGEGEGDFRKHHYSTPSYLSVPEPSRPDCIVERRYCDS